MLVKKAKELGMPAIALTDHGNMYGAKEFHSNAIKVGIKPILGIEIYVASRSRHDKDKEKDSTRYHLILLAKNKTGYNNLIKLTSKAFVEGYYYRPRIDRELLTQYHEGLIVSSACLGGEVAKTIIEKGENAAEEVILWYKNLFGDDYYLEIMLHPSYDGYTDDVYQRQLKVNQSILKLAKKHNIKVIATNDVHFIEKHHAVPHDYLLCITTGKKINDTNRLRYTKMEYLKSYEEMLELFADTPEVLENTLEVAEKVEMYELDSKPIMPYFPLPEEYHTESDYLRHLVNIGAQKRWGTPLPKEVEERINFELETIEKMGFPGYFLIVADFIHYARKNGVIVGPGRGSAAGSAVAYALEITNIDPIKYDLLFERFLNPERISMPDIDIDFDDVGREKIFDYIVKKYGYNRVAHLITFGTMQAKSAIRDVGRVSDLSLPEVNKIIANLPKDANVTITQAKQSDQNFQNFYNEATDLIKNVIDIAQTLEGTIRQTGIHACGIIISRENMDNYIPICSDSKTNLLITQYEGNYIETVGMLKMDFLGLKTLTIIKDCLDSIEQTTGKRINIDQIPLDDKQTYRLFGKGETTAIFQFESTGMKKYLRQLKPTVFEDLVAMNALYRPGPMQYIPSFINRKHGQEQISYDHPLMEPYLQNTYGITVYQEQVMLLSRRLANFSRGQSDNLRKAMGKKKIDEMNKLKELFKEGCLKNSEFIQGCEQNSVNPNELIEKIWSDWEAFAQYAFNKSHSVCYAYIAYQTAYLKEHYPAHFMSSVLSNNLSEIKKISIFTDECRRMKIGILGPSVNHSFKQFSVDNDNNIRFGLAAIKGFGENAADFIIEERKKNGPFNSIYNFFERIDTSILNRKNIESMVYAGVFDEFNIPRAAFFHKDSKDQTFIDQLLKYAAAYRSNKASYNSSLFGSDISLTVPQPSIPKTSEWTKNFKLSREKEYIGMFLSEHPLDEFRQEILHLSNVDISKLLNPEEIQEENLYFAGMIINEEIGTTKNNKAFARYEIEDYTGTIKFTLFNQNYRKYGTILRPGSIVFIHATFETPTWKQDNTTPELTIKNVVPIDEIKTSIIKKLTFKLPFRDVTVELADKLIRSVSNDSSNGIFLELILLNEDGEEEAHYMSDKKYIIDKNLLNIIKEYEIKTIIN